MPATPASDGLIAGRALWRAVVAPGHPLDPCDEAALRAAALRLSYYTSPSMAAWLLSPVAARLPGLVPAAEVERARQFNRFLRTRARAGLAHIHDAGIEVLALKGFATATRFYPDPLIRTMGDVDLLVHPRDLARLCDLLEKDGFRFLRSKGTPRWGLASESSFHPLVSADGGLSFDLHVAADDYPLSRGLDVEDVFATAQRMEIDGLPVAVPCDDHLVLLAMTNAARDKFDENSLRSISDLVAALAITGLAPDWAKIAAIGARGGFSRAFRAAVGLLAALGVPADALPGGLMPVYRWPARSAFDAMVTDVQGIFATVPGKIEKQRRDWLVISPPAVLLRRNLRRIAGLVHPWMGLPAGRSFGAS